MNTQQAHILDVHGDFACFTRPEMKVERYSYPCPTPSAARGIFEAIYFKPEFRWQVTRIEMLSQPAFIALRRNEVKDKISERAVQKWIKGEEVEPLWADGDAGWLGTDQKGRTQRQTMALRRPRFRLHAQIVPRPGQERQHAAFDAQFVRRAAQGKCFQQPYFGCREFVAFFRLVERLESEDAPCDFSHDLGLMLYEVFDLREDNHARLSAFSALKEWERERTYICLFRAKVERGVLDVPPLESDAVLKPSTE